MRSWAEMLGDSLVTGTVAAVGTTLAIAACGRVENRNAKAPINAISHIAWGDQAARRNAASWKYTGTGLGLNALAVGSWAVLYEMMFGAKTNRGNATASLAGGAAVSALAYVVDYYVVPKRLTPGFELRLSNKSLFSIYATLAASLGVTSWLRGKLAK
jgi:hypothetical protein